MKHKKLILSLSVLSIASLPLITMSCTRYSVMNYNKIVTVLKTYAKNNQYLFNHKPPTSIKIEGIESLIKIQYTYFYLEGYITWKTKYNSIEYSGKISGWKQYPNLILHSDSPYAFSWSSSPVISQYVTTTLSLSLQNNSYYVNHDIDITRLQKVDNNNVGNTLTDIFTRMRTNKTTKTPFLSKWINKKTTQRRAITKAKDGARGMPDTPKIKDWFNTTRPINDVFGILSIGNPKDHDLIISTESINYHELGLITNKKDEITYLLGWANNNKTEFDKIFTTFTNFNFENLRTSINNIK